MVQRTIEPATPDSPVEEVHDPRRGRWGGPRQHYFAPPPYGYGFGVPGYSAPLPHYAPRPRTFPCEVRNPNYGGIIPTPRGPLQDWRPTVRGRCYGEAPAEDGAPSLASTVEAPNTPESPRITDEMALALRQAAGATPTETMVTGGEQATNTELLAIARAASVRQLG